MLFLHQDMIDYEMLLNLMAQLRKTRVINLISFPTYFEMSAILYACADA